MGNRRDVEARWIGSSHQFAVVLSCSERDASKSPALWRGIVSYTPPVLDPYVASEQRVALWILVEEARLHEHGRPRCGSCHRLSSDYLLKIDAYDA